MKHFQLRKVKSKLKGLDGWMYVCLIKFCLTKSCYPIPCNTWKSFPHCFTRNTPPLIWIYCKNLRLLLSLYYSDGLVMQAGNLFKLLLTCVIILWNLYLNFFSFLFSRGGNGEHIIWTQLWPDWPSNTILKFFCSIAMLFPLLKFISLLFGSGFIV